MAENEIDLKQPYLTAQLIAYIGNKRALLPFLHDVFQEIAGDRGKTVFFDPFAGSGSVSRLGKAMGFEVHSNDWEPYALAVNRCHLEIDRDDLAKAFRCQGGVDRVFAELCAPGHPGEEYIARHYAPRNTETADYRTERLFYTRENALFIDRIREIIDARYPVDGSIERTVLLASLIYQAATHANTSGVFKAYHHGFGGFGRDALTRIMKPMELQVPVLLNGNQRCRVFCEDALRFVKRGRADICYLDPPYNQHQYGSNYHLLNTITLWDKPHPGSGRAADGRLKEKAGIRKDWVKTKSPFCYRSTARGAMKNLLDSIDSRYIVVSYNTEGIIPIDELSEMLAATGEVSIRTSPYLLYKGGRQSLTRNTYNQEFLLVLDRTSPPGGRRRRAEEESFLMKRKIDTLLRGSFHPDEVNRLFRRAGDSVTYRLKSGKKLSLSTAHGYTLSAAPGFLEKFNSSDLTEVTELLEECRITDRREEAAVITGLLQSGLAPPEVRLYQRRLIRVVKKFAFRKYKDEFEQTVRSIRGSLAGADPKNEAFFIDLAEVERIAELRLNG